MSNPTFVDLLVILFCLVELSCGFDKFDLQIQNFENRGEGGLNINLVKHHPGLNPNSEKS